MRVSYPIVRLSYPIVRLSYPIVYRVKVNVAGTVHIQKGLIRKLNKQGVYHLTKNSDIYTYNTLKVTPMVVGWVVVDEKYKHSEININTMTNDAILRRMCKVIEK